MLIYWSSNYVVLFRGCLQLEGHDEYNEGAGVYPYNLV